MITNGTITLIESPAASGSDGTQNWTTALATAVEACIDDVRSSQRITLGAVIAEATAVIYLMLTDAPGLVIDKEWRVTANQNGQPSKVYQVMLAKTAVGGDSALDHWELFVKVR